MFLSSLVSITTKVPTDTPTQTVNNKAQLTYNSDSQKEVDSFVNYQSIDGGVEGVLPQNVKIIKKDDSGNLLPDIKFKLQILGADGNYSDYKQKDDVMVERATNAKGEIEFKNLDYGKYRIVEVTQLPEYGDPIYSINGTEGINEFTVTDNDSKGFTINVINPLKEANDETTEVIGTKFWNDNDNQDGVRPNEITVNLLADDIKVDSKTVTADADGEWKYEFTDLPKFESGKEIKYTVTENSVENYSTEIDGFSITNTHTPVKISVNGTKSWVDNDNQDGVRPDSIIVNLLANGTTIKSKTVSPDSKDEWKYEFTDLPKFEKGKEITYTVTENSVENYSTTIDAFKITNTHTPGQTSVSVTKAWDDNDDQDGLRVESIEVQLFADGSKSGKVVVLNESNNWTYTWTELDEKKDGKAINYTVDEVTEVEGYTKSITESEKGSGNFIITNSHKPETLSVNGTKSWEDNDNQDGVRPDEITVNLLANGTQIDSKKVTADANGEWKYDFTNLPKFESGKEITYTVTENSVENYSTTIDGFNITNTHTPGQTSVTVTKAWNDSNDKDGLRAKSIEVQLLADGTKSGKVVVLNEANNWTHTWTQLNEKNDGKAITYTVDEVTEVEGYIKSISETGTGNFIITNTHEVKEKVNPTNPTTPTDNSHNLPSTGNGDGLSTVLLGGFLSLIALLGVFGKKYKKQ